MASFRWCTNSKYSTLRHRMHCLRSLCTTPTDCNSSSPNLEKEIKHGEENNGLKRPSHDIHYNTIYTIENNKNVPVRLLALGSLNCWFLRILFTAVCSCTIYKTAMWDRNYKCTMLRPHNQQCKGLEAALGLSAPEAPSFLRLLPQPRASSYVVIAAIIMRRKRIKMFQY